MKNAIKLEPQQSPPSTKGPDVLGPAYLQPRSNPGSDAALEVPLEQEEQLKPVMVTVD